MRHIIHYNKNLKNTARVLRNQSTKAEKILWQALKGKKIKGYDFHRQKPLDNYIVDFFCPELLLALEIDGISHDTKIRADTNRQKQLEALGIRFLRFTDDDVTKNSEGVIMSIERWIEKNTQKTIIHTPNPSPEGS